MKNIFKNSKDLFSQEIMSSFFQRNCLLYLKADKLISLKIFPKKRISKNILVLYKLYLEKDKKFFQRNIWGKTMEKDQFKLLEYLSKTKVKKYLPNYFEYITPLKFSLSEEIAGESTRNLERNFSFWKENIAEIGQILVEFKKINFPPKTLKVYAKGEEKKFLKSSLKEIRDYSPKVWEKYKNLGIFYIKNLFSHCWKNYAFSFSHFDFQPSNVFYDKKGKTLKIVDFDFSRKFCPVLSLANFWVHFYVMTRYHFPKEKVLPLCDKLLQPYCRKSQLKRNFLECFNLFKLRAIIDIAQMTAATFKKPTQKSQRVFEKLDELLKICL